MLWLHSQNKANGPHALFYIFLTRNFNKNYKLIKTQPTNFKTGDQSQHETPTAFLKFLRSTKRKET
jgi:hypothetical protein